MCTTLAAVGISPSHTVHCDSSRNIICVGIYVANGSTITSILTIKVASAKNKYLLPVLLLKVLELLDFLYLYFSIYRPTGSQRVDLAYYTRKCFALNQFLSHFFTYLLRTYLLKYREVAGSIAKQERKTKLLNVSKCSSYAWWHVLTTVH